MPAASTITGTSTAASAGRLGMAPRLETMPDSSTRFLLCRMPPIAAAPRSPDGVSQSGGIGAPASTRSSALLNSARPRSSASKS